ncbi:MAG: RAMP superfamily CRISPR-associated protein [Ostreibacterium sp.]
MWRAFRDKTDRDEDALRKLHRQEAELFGSSAHNDKDKIYGKGKVAVKITQPSKLSPKIEDWPSDKVSDGSAYLALGITGSGDSHREGIPENQTFSVQLIITKVTADQQNELETALKLLGFFGGLGGRSRRALGAIQLQKLGNEEISFSDKADYCQQANTLLSELTTGNKAPYTTFSKETIFCCGNSDFENARSAHAELGLLYKGYRGQPSEFRGQIKKVFGLPLQKVDMNVRRASPLFFHIVEFVEKRFAYSVLYLPSRIFHKDKRHQEVDYSLTKKFVQLIGESP